MSKKPDTNHSSGDAGAPEVQWLDPGSNPWGVPVLDVRPITLDLVSMSANAECAMNAISYGGEDGRAFGGAKPTVERVVNAGLRFRLDRFLADGVLFNPSVMEEKWALYYHGGQILCVRSWLRQVVAVAEVRCADEQVEVHTVRGVLTDESEPPSFTERVLDYLLRSHALDVAYPAPLPAGLECDPSKAALWCFAHFGNRALVATPHELPRTCPDKPLRTHSLLHIAAARGDIAGMEAELTKGVPIDLLAQDGLAPLHWSLMQDDASVMQYLIEHGSSVDVRSADGATPLMNAVEKDSVPKAVLLLDHGADPNAVDLRGFTSLHRAAELGYFKLARLLLERGAIPDLQAQGHTPRSLAKSREHSDVVRLLDARRR